MNRLHGLVMEIFVVSVFPKTQRHIAAVPKVNNLAIANLRSYSLSCTAASWDMSTKCPKGQNNPVWASNEQPYDN